MQLLNERSLHSNNCHQVKSAKLEMEMAGGQGTGLLGGGFFSFCGAGQNAGPDAPSLREKHAVGEPGTRASSRATVSAPLSPARKRMPA